MNVSLRQLKVFLAVARLRNFSRAGDEVGLTQPAVSRCIAELENQLGLKLLDRTTREVELTEAGRGLASRLDRQIEELEATLLDAHGMGSQQRGRVRVATSPSISAMLMPRCIAQCARQYPGIRFELFDQVQMLVLNSVRHGESDFGVVIDPQDREGLHCEKVMDDPFCVVVPPEHPFSRRRSVRWSDLGGEPLLLLDYASGSRPLIDRALSAHNAHWTVAQELGHASTVIQMVYGGIGIAVLAAMALAESDPAGLRTLPLMPRVEREIVLVRRRHRSLSPVAQTVWHLIAQTAAQRQAEVRQSTRAA